MISIIIPSFNRAHLLKWGLMSLSQQIIPYDFETIILSDGLPNDGTKEICNQYKSKLNLRYIYTGRRNSPGNIKWRVPGFALNIGIKQAKGDTILITQPEIYHFSKNNIIKLLDLDDIENERIKNEKTITYPAILKDDIENGFLKDLEQNNRNLTKILKDYNGLNNLRSQYLFFMVISKQVLMEIGGFDEDFVGNCWDDEDFIHRLMLYGCFFIKRNVQVIHLYHPRHNYQSEEIKRGWQYNKNLYNERINLIVRNQNREWGKL